MVFGCTGAGELREGDWRTLVRGIAGVQSVTREPYIILETGVSFVLLFCIFSARSRGHECNPYDNDAEL